MTSYALMEKLKETFWTEIKETKEKEKKNPKPGSIPIFSRRFECFVQLFLHIIIYFFLILALCCFIFSLVTIQLPHTVIKKAQHLPVKKKLFGLPLLRLII